MRIVRRTLAAASLCASGFLFAAVLGGCGSTGSAAPPAEAPVSQAAPEAPASKVAECNGLINVLNDGAVKIDANTKAITAEPMNTNGFLSLARDSDELADNAAKVQVTLAPLRDFRDSYAKVMREFAGTARDVAAGVTAKDSAKMTAGADAMEAIGKREEKIVQDLNAYCQAP